MLCVVNHGTHGGSFQRVPGRDLLVLLHDKQPMSTGLQTGTQHLPNAHFT